MFNHPVKTPSAATPIPSKLIAILSTEQLLSENKRPELIADLAQLSEFESSSFDTLCKRLLHNFANRCQRLPESTVYFSQLGGFLDHSLQRTHAAMHLFRQYLVANPEAPLTIEQQQWWYALFSASLLRGVGRLCLDYKVNRYTLKGQFLKQWEPLLETQGQVSQQVHVEFATHTDRIFRHRLTLLLARLLMPDTGFEWLVSNQKILAIWLALLEEDEMKAGALGAILDRADSIAIQNELHTLPLQQPTIRPERRAAVSSFIDHTPENIPEKERFTAVEFMRWVTQALERGKFLLNRAPILAVPGGLLICPEAFQAFSREHQHYKNWQAVRQSLMALPLYPVDQMQVSQAQHEQHSGLLVPGSLLIPETVHQLAAGASASQPTTATQLALADYPLQLSANGHWTEKAASPISQPTNKAPYG